MIKVKLCYTAENADSDWLEKECMMDEINYEGVIREYVQENKSKAKLLSDKWEVNGDSDSLYLNFRMNRDNPILFRLIDQYMEDLD
jgi:hypothetical protein